MNYVESYLMLMANSPPSFCRTRKVPSDREISRFLAAVLSMFPANLESQRESGPYSLLLQMGITLQGTNEKLNKSVIKLNLAKFSTHSGFAVLLGLV